MHPATRILEHWGEFSLLVGTAAAALVALLFVATSIGVGAFIPTTGGPTRTYMSPVAFHFSSVLCASAVALVPSNTAYSLATLIGLGALCGAIYSAFVLHRLFTDGIADTADRVGYGMLPLASYAVALVSAGLFLRSYPHAPEVLAASLIGLLLVNIRNAWDLLLAMARRQANRAQPPGG
jgi:hypothetical protein